MTTIRYFIPEDGDHEAQPNVFLAPKPRQQGYPPSLGQVKNAFPLPGRYHFRFKSPIVPGTDREKGAMPVWMDCLDDRQPVPVWRSTIVAKVTRIGVEDDDDDDDDDDFVRPNSSSAAAAATTTTQSHHHAPPPPPNRATPPQPAPTPAAPPQPAAAAANMDFFGMDNHTPPAAAQQQHAAPQNHHSQHSTGSADLLGGMHGAPTATTTAPGNSAPNSFGAGASGDLLGMSTPSPPVSGNAYQTPGYHHAAAHQQQQQQQPPPQQQSGPFF